MGELIPISAIVGFFTSVVLVVWFAAQTIQHRSNVRSTQMNRLLDKFGTAEEFLRFAESETGGQVIHAISGGEQEERSQVMRSLRRGVLSVALGVGGIIVGSMSHNWVWVGALGVLLLALGIGFLVSAYIASRFESSTEKHAADTTEGDEVSDMLGV